MKKNFLFTAMAFVMGLIAASCSQDEIISSKDQTGGGTVSIAVNIPVNDPVTRVAPTIPDGYKLRCILQLVKSSDNSDITDGRYVQEVAAGSEKVTFTFNAPSDAYKCLFWADYVKGTVADVATDADNIYNTADLKAIGYTANAGSEMFNSDVADAFYACSLEPASGSGTLAPITLKRPFTKITFTDSQSAYSDYTKITITDLPAPTGFNVTTGETTGYAGKGGHSQISSSELAIEGGKWFSTYLFAGSNQADLGAGNDIKFELKKESSESSEKFSLNGSSITLAGNTEVEATVAPQKNGDTTIDVIFPGEMVNPNKLAVGDYINKDGTWSKNLTDKTIGIVFKLADGITDDGTYDDKTVAGYAMSLCTTQRGAIGSTPPISANVEETIVWANNTYNGFSYSPAILTAMGDVAASVNYTALTTDYKKNDDVTTLSDWYIPSAVQIQDICKQVFGFGQKDSFKAVEDNAVKTAYQTVRQNHTVGSDKKYGTLLNFGRETTTTFMMSSSYDGTNAYTVSVTSSDADTPTEVKQQIISNWSEGKSSVSIRPVLTIFNGISKAQ